MGFDEKVVSFEELLMSQVAQQEALTRLLVEKGYLPSRNSGDGDGFAEGEWIYNNDCVHHLDRVYKLWK
jgi:hypothetical protein